MAISKNWKAKSIAGTTGFDITVTGDANVGATLDVMPKLEKRIPQGTDPLILQLNLLNVSDATPGNFKAVKYSEHLPRVGQYQNVEIFFHLKVIEKIKVSIQ